MEGEKEVLVVGGDRGGQADKRKKDESFVLICPRPLFSRLPLPAWLKKRLASVRRSQVRGERCLVDRGR